jgi:hypothetical protein
MGEYVPPYVLAEMGRTILPSVTDIVSAQLRKQYAIHDGYLDPELHRRLQPRLRPFGRMFPASEITLADLKLRYVPVAIRQTDVPLELINSEGRVGRRGIDIWRDDIASIFGQRIARGDVSLI